MAKPQSLRATEYHYLDLCATAAHNCDEYNATYYEAIAMCVRTRRLRNVALWWHARRN